MSIPTKEGQSSSVKMPSQQPPRWRVPLLCLGLAAITFAVFGQTLRHDFINFDDNDYVYENPVVARGLTLRGLVWAFSFHASNWHPLTWVSHMLDCQLYGMHAGGHHLTNVLLHTATVILLFLVLRQMTGALWRSAFVAAVFAIHPLRVESVAWVAERKDVLSGLFFMLTIGAYVRYVDEFKVQPGFAKAMAGKRSRFKVFYGLSILFFVLGLMSKPMLVTLPLVLLLLDYWPLQRVQWAKRLMMEKLPFLALSAAACIVTLLAQGEGIQSAGSYALPQRLGNAVVACAIYLVQMVWPAGLAVFYPYPQHGLPTWEIVLAGVLLASLTTVAWAARRARPWVLVGWLWYLVMLLPVVGVIHVGEQAHADRYTYLPQIGIYVSATWLVAQWRVSRLALAALLTSVIAALMGCAWQQSGYWQDSETLWNRTLACTKDNIVAHWNFGFFLRQKGRIDEAIPQFQLALQIDPANMASHNNLGNALGQAGRMDEAITQYQMALQINPAGAEAHNNLGSALCREGRMYEALSQYQQALQIDPGNPKIQNNLAWLLATCADGVLRNGNQAVELAGQANELSGGADPVILATLSAALAESGRFSDAQRTAEQAMELARRAGQQELVEELNGELKLYAAGLPCRQ